LDEVAIEFSLIPQNIDRADIAMFVFSCFFLGFRSGHIRRLHAFGSPSLRGSSTSSAPSVSRRCCL
ncbi:MAG: hypothetical protein ACR2II_02435, partial [Chthoniobacterales bacterium]